MQRAVLLLSILCTASVAFCFAPPRTPSLSAKPNIGLTFSSCETHHVGLRKRVAAGGGWQARAVRSGPRRTIFSSSGGSIQEDEANKNLEARADDDGGWSLPGAGWMKGAVDRLKGYGPAGVIAYGLLNELYYTTAFAFLWLGPMGAAAIVAPASLGLRETVAISMKQFGKVAALVWLGSQATKPLRMALALLLAPAAEGLLTSTERRLRLPSRQAAFGVLLVTILGSTAAFGAAAVAFAAARSAAAAASTITSSASPKASAAVVLLLGLQQGQFGAGAGRGSVGVGGGGGMRSLASVGSGSSIDQTIQRWYVRPGASEFFHRMACNSAATCSAADPTQCTTVTAPAAGRVVTREDEGVNEKLDASSREPNPAMRRLAAPRRMSPQKAADRNPPPQDNIHGWKEHPNHLLGFWEIGRAEALSAPEGSRAPEAIVAAAPSVEAAAALAAQPTLIAPESAAAAGEACDGPSQDGGAVASAGTDVREGREGESVRSQRNPLEAGGFSDRETAERDMVDLGSDVLHHVEYVVLKRDGTFKAGPAGIGVSPRSWRFAPANRRILFEVDVPARGITLRYSGKLKRKPGMFTRASGVIRARPMSQAEGDRELPASSRLWPKLAGFAMTLDLPKKFRHRKRPDGGEEGRGDTSLQH